MKNITARVNDGAISLKNISTEQLIEWASQTDSYEDRDTLGCEIMYRNVQNREIRDGLQH